MGAVNTPLIDDAKTIFRDLGYEVTAEGEELRAERKWREVYVTTKAPAEAPETGRFRCFVAREEEASSVRASLVDLAPDYDWAVVSVDDAGDYEVLHPGSDVLPAP